MKRVATVLFLLFSLSLVAQAADKAAQEKAAQGATDQFLALTDAGHYAQSWDAASTFFKSAITKEKWNSALTSVRQPLGPVQSRKLLSATYTHELPGAPDGDYVVVKYETSFENKKSSVETLATTLEKDGQWKVSGYFIK
jgi:hypothetical protein